MKRIVTAAESISPLGVEMKEWRKVNNVTLAQLALAMLYYPIQIDKVEKGREDPPPRMAKEFEDVKSGKTPIVKPREKSREKHLDPLIEKLHKYAKELGLVVEITVRDAK